MQSAISAVHGFRVIGLTPLHETGTKAPEPAEKALDTAVFKQPLLYSENLVAEQIERLLDRSLGEEATERLMAWFQNRLRAHDTAIADALEAAVVERDSAIALETLAAARASSYIGQTYRALRAGLESGDPGTRFAAVAAISDLPFQKQWELAEPLTERVGEAEPDAEVRRAAQHLLRRIGKRDARD